MSKRSGGVTQALAAIRADEGLSIRKAKRRFLRYVWKLTSPGLQQLSRIRAGLPVGPVSERRQGQIDAARGRVPLTRNERRLMRKLEKAAGATT